MEGIMTTVNTSVVATLGTAVAILAFLWTLHSDIADLRERMARLEVSFAVLTEVLVDERRRSPSS